MTKAKSVFSYNFSCNLIKFQTPNQIEILLKTFKNFDFISKYDGKDNRKEVKWRDIITDIKSTRVYDIKISIFFIDNIWINANVKEYHISMHAILDG